MIEYKMSLVKFFCKNQTNLAKIRSHLNRLRAKLPQTSSNTKYGTSSMKCPDHLKTNLKTAIAATNGFISPLEGLICQPHWDDVKEMNHKTIEELFLPKLEVSKFPALQMLPLMPYIGHYKLFSLAAGQPTPNYSEKDLDIDCFTCLNLNLMKKHELNAEDLIESTRDKKSEQK